MVQNNKYVSNLTDGTFSINNKDLQNLFNIQHFLFLL